MTPALFVPVALRAPVLFRHGALRAALAVRQNWYSQHRWAGAVRFKCRHDVEMSHIYGDRPLPRAVAASFVQAVVAAPAWAAITAEAATTKEGAALLAVATKVTGGWTPGQKLPLPLRREAAELAGLVPNCIHCRGKKGSAVMALAGALLRDTSRLRAGLNELRLYDRGRFIVFP